MRWFHPLAVDSVVARNSVVLPCTACASRAMASAEGEAQNIKILKTDMGEDMIKDIHEITAAAFSKHKLHKDIATNIKSGFDKKHPPVDNKATSGVVHCIVGTDFACSVTHETHWSCYWSCDNVKILLWKSKDSPFD